jgi:hypothetical protein
VRNIFQRVFVCAVLLCASSASHGAFTLYTSQAAFSAAIASPGIDTYAGFSITATTLSPINRSAGAYTYTAAAPGDFFGAGTTANPWLSTNTATDTITVNALPASVRGIGGNFFASNIAGAFLAGDVTIAVTDAGGTTTQTITGATTSSFLGFVSDGSITSLTISAVQTASPVWPTVDNLTMGVTAAVAAPPQFAYAPVAGSTIAATGGGALGSTGNFSIAATIGTAGSGTGAASTTTTTCTAPTGAFAGFAQSVSAVGSAASTTGGPLTGTCTLGATATTQTLTCSENRGGTNVAQTWTLSCPQATEPPALTYAPNTGSTVNFTGVTTVGSTGSGSISVTPSGGLNTGAGATTTVNNCGLTGADAASFAGASAVNLSFVGATTTAQNIALTCTSGAAALNATLTCDEKRGAAAAVSRSWPLVCPVGSAAPQFAYAPAAGSTIAATGGGAVGSTGNFSIAATIGTAGSGTGAASTTTTTCTAPTGAFAGFAQSVSAVGSAASTTGGPLTGTCTLGAAATTQTLTCSENRGGTNVAQTWTLSCPAGNLLAVTSSVPDGGTVTLPPVAVGSPSPSAAIGFTNPNTIAAVVTCVAPASPFVANPLVLNLAANGGSQSVTVSAGTSSAGVFGATLSCSVNGSQQTFSFLLNASVSGAAAAATAVPLLGSFGYAALLLSLMLAGVFGVAVIRRE